MTNTPFPHAGALLGAQAKMQTITTRFGDLVVDLQNAMYFPHGLLGFPGQKSFVLADFSGDKMQQFRILQSLDDHSLSFIAMPLDLENPLVGRGDILDAATDLAIAADNLEIYIIVSVQRTPLRVRITGNVRAPLFIDVSRKIGEQHVFQNSRYQVQHELG